MTIRSTSLCCAWIIICFFEDNSMTLDYYVKISTHFECLKLHVFNNLIPGQLNAHEFLKENLEFHADEACCTKCDFFHLPDD